MLPHYRPNYIFTFPHATPSPPSPPSAPPPPSNSPPVYSFAQQTILARAVYSNLVAPSCRLTLGYPAIVRHRDIPSFRRHWPVFSAFKASGSSSQPYLSTAVFSLFVHRRSLAFTRVHVSFANGHTRTSSTHPQRRTTQLSTPLSPLSSERARLSPASHPASRHIRDLSTALSSRELDPVTPPRSTHLGSWASPNFLASARSANAACIGCTHQLQHPSHRSHAVPFYSSATSSRSDLSSRMLS